MESLKVRTSKEKILSVSIGVFLSSFSLLSLICSTDSPPLTCPSATPLQEAVNGFVLDPRYAELLTLVKAARNGAVYGAKIRFPHALV